jgi:hypothetical protein
MVLSTDFIENFEYYYPTFNACNLKEESIGLSGKRDLAKKHTMRRLHPSATKIGLEKE